MGRSGRSGGPLLRYFDRRFDEVKQALIDRTAQTDRAVGHLHADVLAGLETPRTDLRDEVSDLRVEVAVLREHVAALRADVILAAEVVSALATVVERRLDRQPAELPAPVPPSVDEVPDAVPDVVTWPFFLETALAARDAAANGRVRVVDASGAGPALALMLASAGMSVVRFARPVGVLHPAVEEVDEEPVCWNPDEPVDLVLLHLDGDDEARRDLLGAARRWTADHGRLAVVAPADAAAFPGSVVHATRRVEPVEEGWVPADGSHRPDALELVVVS